MKLSALRYKALRLICLPQSTVVKKLAEMPVKNYASDGVED